MADDEAHERADEDLLAAYRELQLALQHHMETEETTTIPHIHRRSPRDGRLLLEEHRYLRRRLVEVGLSLSARALRELREEVAAHDRTESRIFAQWLGTKPTG